MSVPYQVNLPRALLRRRIALRALATLPSGFTAQEAAWALLQAPWTDPATGDRLRRFTSPYEFLTELVEEGVLDVLPRSRGVTGRAHAYLWVDEPE